MGKGGMMLTPTNLSLLLRLRECAQTQTGFMICPMLQYAIAMGQIIKRYTDEGTLLICRADITGACWPLLTD